MIWVIIGIIVGILVFVLTYFELRKESQTGIFVVSFIGAFLAFFMIALIPNGFLSDKYIYQEKSDKIISSYNIYSIADKTEVNGSFVLGVGSLDTYDYYVFYKETEKGLIRENVRTSSTYINMTDDVTPKIEITETTFKQRSKNFWLCISFGPKYSKKTTTIYVPADTIQQNFNLTID